MEYFHRLKHNRQQGKSLDTNVLLRTASARHIFLHGTYIRLTFLNVRDEGSVLLKLRKDDSRPKHRSHPNDGWSARGDDTQSKENFEGVPQRYTLIFLGILGAIPFTWKKPRLPSLHPAKSTFVVALLIYIGMSFSEYALYKGVTFQIRQNESIQDKILALEVTVVCLYHFVVLSMWKDVSKANRAIDLWIQLGTSYKRLLGYRMPVQWRTREKILIVEIVLVPSMAFYFGKQTMSIQLPYTWALGIVYNNCIVCSICSLWIGHFACLGSLAKDVNHHLKIELQQNSLSLGKLRIYHQIWTEMRSLSDILSLLTAPILICILNVATVIVFIYNTILLFTSGNFSFAISHLVFTWLLLALLLGMVRNSHIAVHEIKNFYSDIISLESFEKFKGPIACEIINLCLVEKSRSIAPTFGGYVFVNKTFACSIITAITTHLVILVQFFSYRNNYHNEVGLKRS